MRILHLVESYLPARHGMQEVVTQISETLVKKGHQVTVATRTHPNRRNKVINGVEITEFAVQGNAVYGITGEAERYTRFLIESDFDIITLFAAQQWATDLALPILSKIKGRKFFVPTGFSGFRNPDYKEYFEKMKEWFKEFYMNIFLSDDYQDINFARINGIKNVTVIPNGASFKEFVENPPIEIRKKLNISREKKLILHVGSYTGIKGHGEALEIFLNAKIRNVVLLMIGENDEFIIKENVDKKLSRLKTRINFLINKKQVIIKTCSREETVAAFKTADLFLFPSQLECSPIVLFEAMASRTPFLATAVGNTAEIINWSDQAGVLLPTKFNKEGYGNAEIEKSTKILEEVIAKPENLKNMGIRGYKKWQSKFTWEKISDCYEDLYRKALEKAFSM